MKKRKSTRSQIDTFLGSVVAAFSKTHLHVATEKAILDFVLLMLLLHLGQEVVVKGLGRVPGHGEVEIWLVALQGVVQRELADAQNFQIEILDAFHPSLARIGRIFEEPEVQNFPDNKLEFFASVCAMDADEDAEAAALIVIDDVKSSAHG